MLLYYTYYLTTTTNITGRTLCYVSWRAQLHIYEKRRKKSVSCSQKIIKSASKNVPVSRSLAITLEKNVRPLLENLSAISVTYQFDFQFSIVLF